MNIHTSHKTVLAGLAAIALAGIAGCAANSANSASSASSASSMDADKMAMEIAQRSFVTKASSRPSRCWQATKP